MEVKDLRYFIAVYESRGVARAGAVLGTVQSNVSARIKALEQLLGVSLFERHYRGIVPTEHGKRLYEHAKQMLATFESAELVLRLEMQGAQQ